MRPCPQIQHARDSSRSDETPSGTDLRPTRMLSAKPSARCETGSADRFALMRVVALDSSKGWRVRYFFAVDFLDVAEGLASR